MKSRWLPLVPRRAVHPVVRIVTPLGQVNLGGGDGHGRHLWDTESDGRPGHQLRTSADSTNAAAFRPVTDCGEHATPRSWVEPTYRLGPSDPSARRPWTDNDAAGSLPAYDPIAIPRSSAARIIRAGTRLILVDKLRVSELDFVSAGCRTTRLQSAPRHRAGQRLER